MNLLLISVAPIVIILFYVYYRDKYEKEPISLLAKGLFAGMIITIPVIFAEQAVASALPYIFTGKIGHAFGNAFLVAAMCEEAFKLLAVYILVWKNPNFNERFDGIVYAVFVSLGFALVENILYVFSNGMSTGIARAFTAVPAHAMFGIMMGYYLGLAKFSKQNSSSLFIMAFFIPFLFHGIYDFILMVQINWVLIFFFPFLIFLMYKTNGKMTELNKKSIFRFR
ncbi:PrsW family glutamic-type intramembrane protease [Marinifilum caeruleilacunae]|uniref:Protease PrsW n=1 Tax=Marinifilum caeruleilacunae TaxID=2499076 RepID=A0ABX1WU06_9BACT|nr:PrsW family glutamic-type intramembrane protease [Marinifilum caeruleilacunae]NOU59496.1 PrsW family intramembrane metalloprotease [Marinifilum caeruleilacunae]